MLVHLVNSVKDSFSLGESECKSDIANKWVPVSYMVLFKLKLN